MKEIKLTKGFVTIVDDDMCEQLNQFKWHYSNGYARCNITVNGKQQLLLMHRVVNQTPEGLDTDHISSDKLDNRKENLQCNLAVFQIYEGHLKCSLYLFVFLAFWLFCF